MKSVENALEKLKQDPDEHTLDSVRNVALLAQIEVFIDIRDTLDDIRQELTSMNENQ